MRARAEETNFEEWDESVDIANTERMKQIIEEVGWPTVSKVGQEAANKAWLLVQHADHDPAFQEMCLGLMEESAEGEVDKGDMAYLIDRVRVNTGREQLYGTQFGDNESGEYGVRPVENIEELNQRREEVGLEPFEDYERHMLDSYGHKEE